jgi:hypothetical protein
VDENAKPQTAKASILEAVREMLDRVAPCSRELNKSTMRQLVDGEIYIKIFVEKGSVVLQCIKKV